MKISVIIPVYNVAKYLRECLDSLLEQSYGQWEAICVDDGSTDDSSNILDAYSSRDGRFVVVHQHNAGVAMARNNGIEKATGDYVGFVDADDVIGVDWLKAAVDAIESTQADMVKMRIRRDFCFPTYNKPEQFAVYRGAEIYRWSALKGGLTVQNFYRRTTLSHVRFPEKMRIYEDGIFNLYALENIRLGVQSEYDGYGYRFSETSSFSQRITEDEYCRLIRECTDWIFKSRKHLDGVGAHEIALSRIREYISGRVMEWVRQPEERKGNSSLIACAARVASEKIGASIAPSSGLRKICFKLYYEKGNLSGLRFLDFIERAKRRVRRGLR